MEIRDLLESYGYDGENTPVVTGSALCAIEVRLCVCVCLFVVLELLERSAWLSLECTRCAVWLCCVAAAWQDTNEELGKNAINKLMDAVDNW